MPEEKPIEYLIDKMPARIRNHIGGLNLRISMLEQQLKKRAAEATRVQLFNILRPEKSEWLPNSTTVRFYFPPTMTHDNYIEVLLREPALQIRSGASMLRVHPEASNTISVIPEQPK